MTISKTDNPYRSCNLCPRACGVDRTLIGKGEKAGVCGESDRLRVAYVGPHFGEEPPISGTKGSGTVFFTGCPVGCVFCQNYQISRNGMGKEITTGGLIERLAALYRREGIHNINFVSPDHFFPHAFEVVEGLRGRGIRLPVVYNLSGYQSKSMIRVAEEFADIYLPDFKYSRSKLAAKYSSCPDYPGVALDAIEEMVKQKGLLDVFEKEKDLAEKGVLVRHLVLPGHVDNSLDALTSLFVEFGKDLPISLMSQYHPVPGSLPHNLRRRLLNDEFDRVYGHLKELGFRNVFVQFPEKAESKEAASGFLPDFNRKQPFCKS